VESAEDLLAQAHADELADTELIVEAVPDEDIVRDDDAAEHAAPDSATDEVAGQEQAPDNVRTMTLFDYMAAHPTARQGKGKKARTSPPSAQLLLFDLFTEQPTTDAVDAPTAGTQQRGLFADADEREEVA